MNEDEQQLRAYIEHGSETAFSDLVTRYIDLVYSVAVRLVGGDTHLAQDVVQTVFTDLSRKAKILPHRVVLSGWLCRHTFFVASSIIRAEQRRRNRERQVAQMNASDDSTESNWDRLCPILDEVLQSLGTQDRDAIVLRYFHSRNNNCFSCPAKNVKQLSEPWSRKASKKRSLYSQSRIPIPIQNANCLMTSSSFLPRCCHLMNSRSSGCVIHRKSLLSARKLGIFPAHQKSSKRWPY